MTVDMERPDLSGVDDAVRAYIERLEQQLLQQSQPKGSSAAFEPSEPPTSVNVITVTRSGFAKRTPRHLYSRQRRGGMGVFDIDAGDDPPVAVGEAHNHEDILLITDQGRIFRISTARLPETEVRGRGEPLAQMIQLLKGEQIRAVLPADRGLYVNLVSQRGWVRHVRRQYLAGSMIQGIRYHNVSEGGYVTAACWSDGSSDILIATRQGKAIRFSESQIPNPGRLGIRLDPDDETVAITATDDDGGVFVLGHDGKGSIRLMEGFRKNNAPGAGGKQLLKTDRLIGAESVTDADDIFAISGLSKIIRFAAEEVPPKSGTVQGVNCINTRGDEVAAFFVSRLPAEATDVE